MKKWILAFTIILCMIPLARLAGCSQDFLSDRLDIERLLPVQTLGLDRDGDTVTVSLAVNGTQTAPSMVMKSPAPNIETALTRLQDYSPADELYYEHIQYILLGESMAEEGIDPLLDWVERSPFLRMDTDLFLVKGSAADTIASASGEMGDITERLSGLDRTALSRSQHVYTILEIASSLADRGTALCAAVERVPSEGIVASGQGSAGDSLLPAGYAVLKDGVLLTYLTAEESLGTSLFREDPSGTVITVEDTSVEFLQGRAQAKAFRAEDGTLTGIAVTARLKAGILEAGEKESDLSALEESFSRGMEEALRSAVTRSQTLSCDFLGLEDAILPTTGKAARALSEDWDRLFPTLPVYVTVEGELLRGYDRKD